MRRLIVTGSYTASAMKAMVGNPSDREAAARAIVEAAGGTLESFYVLTGESNFSIKVSIDDPADLMAGLMVTGADDDTEMFNFKVNGEVLWSRQTPAQRKEYAAFPWTNNHNF